MENEAQKNRSQLVTLEAETGGYDPDRKEDWARISGSVRVLNDGMLAMGDTPRLDTRDRTTSVDTKDIKEKTAS